MPLGHSGQLGINKMEFRETAAECLEGFGFQCNGDGDLPFIDIRFDLDLENHAYLLAASFVREVRLSGTGRRGLVRTWQRTQLGRVVGRGGQRLDPIYAILYEMMRQLAVEYRVANPLPA